MTDRPARRILNNLFYLSAGELLARLAHFAAFAHLARALGPSGFGGVGFAMTVASYLLIPVLQGYDSVGIREVARDHRRVEAYAGGILAIRLLSAAAVWLALLGALALFPPEPRLGALLALFGLTLFPAAASLKWAFQALERNRPVAVAGIVAQLIFAAGAFTVRGPDQSLEVPLYLLAGEMAGALLLAGVFCRSVGRLGLVWDRAQWRALFRESAPLALSTLLGTLLFNFDVLALAWFRTPAEVGVYTALYRLVLLLFAPLTLFQLSIFPTLARAPAGELKRLAGTALRYLAAVFAPLPVAGLFAAGPALGLLFGAEYAAGATALRILLWALPLMALRSLFRIILVSRDLQRLDLRAVAAATVTNVGLDLILVPGSGVVGAAVSTLSSEVVLLALSWRYLRSRLWPALASKEMAGW